MPRSLSNLGASGVAGDGHNAIHSPGAYAYVLAKVCQEEVKVAESGAWLIASDNPARLAEFEREQAVRVAALIEQRTGEPVSARSAHLPKGLALPPPFQRYGAQWAFAVTSDDVIRRKAGE